MVIANATSIVTHTEKDQEPIEIGKVVRLAKGFSASSICEFEYKHFWDEATAIEWVRRKYLLYLIESKIAELTAA